MDEHLAAARQRRQQTLGHLKRPLRNFGSVHLACGLLLGACEIAIFAALAGPEPGQSRKLHQLVVFLSPIFIVTGLLSLGFYFTPPASLRNLGILSVVAAAAALTCSLIGVSVVSNSLQDHDTHATFSLAVHAVEAALLAAEALASVGHLVLGCKQFCCRALHPLPPGAGPDGDNNNSEAGVAEEAFQRGGAAAAAPGLPPYYQQSNQEFVLLARGAEDRQLPCQAP